MSTEPELIQSPLNQTIHRDGHALQVDIYRSVEEADWLLEVINEEDTSHVWDDRFPTDHAALAALHEAIDEEGIDSPLPWADASYQPRRALTDQHWVHMRSRPGGEA